MKLLLSKSSQSKYNQFAKQPPQALLLLAPKGSGKQTILNHLAKEITGQSAGAVQQLVCGEGQKTIGIDQIRNLKKLYKLASNDMRVVVIPQAGALTTEAQNSFLKLLEEPPKKVHFFLGSDSQNELLETIISRCVVWQLASPTSKQIADYFNQYPPEEINKAQLIAQNKVGLIDSILQNAQDHPLLKAIEQSKNILTANSFKRLVQIEGIVKEDGDLGHLLAALDVVTAAAFEQSVVKNNKNAKLWLKRNKLVKDSQTMLNANQQPKLVLTRLFLML